MRQWLLRRPTETLHRVRMEGPETSTRPDGSLLVLDMNAAAITCPGR